jgi:cytochrome c peroxidase
MPVPETNPLTSQKISLGRKLFFDKRLSRDGTFSCASCHDPKLSFSDGRKVARGINGQEGTRNAPAIINRGYGRTFFWDGRVKSLEQQVLEPILNPKELGMTESLVESRTHLRIAGVTAYFMTRAVSRFRVRRRIVGRSRSQLCGRSRALLRTCTTEAFRRWKTWSITMIGAGTRIRI